MSLNQGSSEQESNCIILIGIFDSAEVHYVNFPFYQYVGFMPILINMKT